MPLPIDKEFLHHAYCISGERGTVCAELFQFIERDLKIPRVGNPDFYYEAFDALGIDDARKLYEMQSKKGFSNTRKIFVVAAHTLSLEAQNALLKLFEEPAPQTHFFLVIGNVERLLPTLRSRMFIVDGGGGKIHTARAKEFLGMDIASRFALAQGLSEDLSDKKIDRQEIVSFFDGLETELRKLLLKNPTREIINGLEVLLIMRSYLTDRSVSVKLLFDAVSANLPVMQL